MNKDKAEMSILDAMYETAQGLYQHGFIDKQKLIEIELLKDKKLLADDGQRIKTCT